MNILTKSICGLFCAVAALLGSCQVAPQSPLKMKPSYVAIETNTGRVLYSSQANERRPIGMLSNVACALVVLDWAESRGISLDTVLTVPAEACQFPKTNLLHLKPGDQITLRDALHSTIMWDDSACAITMAYACGRSIPSTSPLDGFVAQMNQLARAIGMTNTHFKGCHGSVVSYSTARDMALLGTYAMQKPSFRGISCKQTYQASVNGVPVGIRNTNRMVQYASVDGVKAASSASAGCCLIASATRASVKLPNPQTGQPATYAQRIVVVMLGMHSSNQRYQAASDMLRDGWAEWEDWARTQDTSDQNKFILLPH